MPLMIDNYDSFYLQPRPVLRRTRRRRAHLSQRRNHAGRDRGAQA
ncbi:hypothetical protein ACU4GD_38295 [Cupriavidus basilensis]